ncbi:hypothetical protein OPKNFCMD_4286 [Methylobacterium crusticola]|uniref:YjiS-like domain-containing protein n=1 Tax=Methylobacterium crusticola TaxID=1697972 RepID=A0ABQ4R3X1_9HYPH|nr:DUF1127 domain-containing protein [Methylobacterium crusticola]GJD51531.1 hypothetical protein OPKNFCMD_4286 [Methylobacterium crusticola]
MTATVIPFPSGPGPVAPARAQCVSPAHEARPPEDRRPALWWRRWSARRRLARELDGMSEAALADVGLTRAEARAEVRRPFWRGGAHDGG